MDDWAQASKTMAAMFDCSLATIWLHMNDANSEFAKAYKKGAARTSGLKRAKQINAAGVVPMSIWVGKLLGHFDTPTTHVMVAQANSCPPRP